MTDRKARAKTTATATAREKQGQQQRQRQKQNWLWFAVESGAGSDGETGFVYGDSKAVVLVGLGIDWGCEGEEVVFVDIMHAASNGFGEAGFAGEWQDQAAAVFGEDFDGDVAYVGVLRALDGVEIVNVFFPVDGAEVRCARGVDGVEGHAGVTHASPGGGESVEISGCFFFAGPGFCADHHGPAAADPEDHLVAWDGGLLGDEGAEGVERELHAVGEVVEALELEEGTLAGLGLFELRGELVSVSGWASGEDGTVSVEEVDGDRGDERAVIEMEEFFDGLADIGKQDVWGVDVVDDNGNGGGGLGFGGVCRGAGNLCGLPSGCGKEGENGPLDAVVEDGEVLFL
uniref:Uncharacterized protein n=1 Tax=mine drainage metagenome TaxID=410659 RepID=E6PYJ7_9ZZZZ